MPGSVGIGPRISPLIGPLIGVGDDPMAGVTRDATSQKYAPNTLAEWNIALAAAGLSGRTPSNLYRCQEASGDLADSIGSAVLTAANSPGYQQSVTGWTRKAVTWSDATNKKFTNFTDIPTLTNNSAAYLGYFFTSNTPAAEREIGGMGNATVFQIRVTTASKYKIIGPAGANATGAVNYGANVRPVLAVFFHASFSLKLYTDAEIIDPSNANGVTGGGIWLGGQTTTAPDGGCLYLASWVSTGTAAEFTDAEARGLLQTLGWTVAW